MQVNLRQIPTPAAGDRRRRLTQDEIYSAQLIHVSARLDRQAALLKNRERMAVSRRNRSLSAISVKWNQPCKTKETGELRPVFSPGHAFGVRET